MKRFVPVLLLLGSPFSFAGPIEEYLKYLERIHAPHANFIAVDQDLQFFESSPVLSQTEIIELLEALQAASARFPKLDTEGRPYSHFYEQAMRAVESIVHLHNAEMAIEPLLLAISFKHIYPLQQKAIIALRKFPARLTLALMGYVLTGKNFVEGFQFSETYPLELSQTILESMAFNLRVFKADPLAYEITMELLRQDSSVARWAIRGLSGSADVRMLDIAALAKKSKDSGTRKAGLMALRYLPESPKLAQVIREGLQKRKSYLENVGASIALLGRTDLELFLPLVETALSSPVDQIRRNAVLSLATLKSTLSLTYLKNYGLNDRDELTAFLAETVIEERYGEAVLPSHSSKRGVSKIKLPWKQGSVLDDASFMYAQTLDDTPSRTWWHRYRAGPAGTTCEKSFQKPALPE